MSVTKLKSIKRSYSNLKGIDFTKYALSITIKYLQWLEYKFKLCHTVHVKTIIQQSFLSFPTNAFEQVEQNQFRLFLEKQSEQDLHCLLIFLHLFEALLHKIPMLKFELCHEKLTFAYAKTKALSAAG